MELQILLEKPCRIPFHTGRHHLTGTLLEVLQPRPVLRLDGELDAEGFELRSEAEDLVDFDGRQLGHNRSSVGVTRHQSKVLELIQGFTNW